MHCENWGVSNDAYSTQGGWTPLMTASQFGHVDVVKALIVAKVQVNTQAEVCMLLCLSPSQTNTAQHMIINFTVFL